MGPLAIRSAHLGSVTGAQALGSARGSFDHYAEHYQSLRNTTINLHGVFFPSTLRSVVSPQFGSPAPVRLTPTSSSSSARVVSATKTSCRLLALHPPAAATLTAVWPRPPAHTPCRGLVERQGASMAAQQQLAVAFAQAVQELVTVEKKNIVVLTEIARDALAREPGAAPSLAAVITNRIIQVCPGRGRRVDGGRRRG